MTMAFPRNPEHFWPLLWGGAALALVAALPYVGIARLKQWYRTAIDQRYRFYSYGDAMLVFPPRPHSA